NRLVFGSGDGRIYCLDVKKGNELWRFTTKAAVLGSPLINGEKVFIGGSDHSFRCIDLKTGKQLWSFDSLKGPVVSTPVVSNGQVIFGAWDTYLYALDAVTGQLKWKWSNGTSVRNFSPAACVPTVHDSVVYVVAPDRYITAIDAVTGKTLWRSNEATVRESMGMSGDGRFVYGKTMQDTVVAFATGKARQSAALKMHVGYGYEHAPSMLIENEGIVFFGTRNGVVYAIDPANHSVRWAHKIDNSMVNTVRLLNNGRLLASTMDGKLVMLQWEK
ncbi:MAG TPA: PQQ-binding-like beta-propeller repeat protein, partial [Phnomibacter sp.]|nr:PQQ-binding-like beta-propeller repeat protein [Phnomibacter sp.]